METFYCSDSDYHQTTNQFRTHKIGRSVDQPTSMRKAIQTGQIKMAESIQTTLQNAINQYFTSRGIIPDEFQESRIIEISEQVSDELIEKVNVICEETQQTRNGLFKTYIVLEISTVEVLNELEQIISEDPRLQIKIDSYSFKNILQTEMEKEIEISNEKQK